MATSQITGLASGLDTASIVAQLMQLEALPQTRLKTQLSSEQSSVKSLQELNAKLASLVTEAGKLAGTTGWSPVKVTTTDAGVTVTGSEGAVPANLSLTVTSLAKAHQVRFAPAAATDTVASSSIRIDFADASVADVTLDLSRSTLDGVVAALNGSGTGVRASKVDVGGGQFGLIVTSTATGAASQFSISNADGTPLGIGAGTVVASGSDAAATIGGIPVTSATNTLTNVSGLSITLGPATTLGTPIGVDVASDTSSLKTTLKALVDNVNAGLKSFDALTTYDASTKTAGALYGDSTLRFARNALAGAIYASDGTSVGDVGIQVDRTGKLTFDEATFDAAYAKDAAAVSAKFTTAATGGVDGFAARLEAVAKRLSDSTDGTVTTAIKSHNGTIDRMQDRIEAWDRTLTMRRATLDRQFSALETALSTMQAQSSWLASQLSTAPTSSS